MFSSFCIRKNILLIISATITLLSCKSAGNNSSATETNTDKKDTGWISLFNGKTISQWHSYGKDNAGTAWKAEDSVLHLDASIKDDWQTKDGGDMVTNDEFENFDLKLDWKISGGGNSGIMFYVHEDTSKYKYSWESGPELQVADNEKNEDGKVYKSRAGDLYELVPSTSQQYVKPAEQWNHVEIIANKGKLDEYMNGQHVLSTILWNNEWNKSVDSTKFKALHGFGTYKKGRIALQDHGADVWFKNIQIKKL